MISGIFHAGSGLGDQLFRYITARTLAEKKNYQWGMIGQDHFKGMFFSDFDMGLSVFEPPKKAWEEKCVRDEQGNDIRSYDPEINFVEDDTVIDGCFEDNKYWSDGLDKINEWLKVEPLEVPDGHVALGFRGGEYYADTKLGLHKDYFEAAIDHLGQKYEYEVHTDSPDQAMAFFHGTKAGMSFVNNSQISHSRHSNMGFNWRSMRYAKLAIIPNSAFYIIPRILKHHEDPMAVTIAPRFWARRNTKTWSRPACYYPEFLYM